jgi:hypothetical protein
MTPLTDEEKKIIESIKDSCLSDGIKVLLEDIRKHKNTADTIKIMPLFDQNMKLMLSSQSDEMLKRAGYVSALEWVIGMIEYYQTYNFNENQGDGEENSLFNDAPV